MNRLLRFPTARRCDPAVDAWMRRHPGELGAIAQRWFQAMRGCGDDVRELLHDGHQTACVGDAAFGYVNAFTPMSTSGSFVAPRSRIPAACSKAPASSCAT